jgi:multiple sugar transport system substrate-binding protein
MTTQPKRANLWRMTSFILALALVLTACSSAPTTPVPTPTPVEKQTLRVLTLDSGPIGTVLDIVIKAFEQTHPNVKVVREFINHDPAQQVAEMAAQNNLPDVVFSIDALTPSLVQANLLLDMRELASMGQGFNLDSIIPRAISQGNVQSNPGLYMIPAVLESVQMFYNKDLFVSSGAPTPAADWTWDDLIAACKLIQDKHADVKCISYTNPGMPEAGWWGYLVPWIRGYGGDVLSQDGKMSTFSRPESLAGIKAYLELWTKQRVAVPPDQRGFCFGDQKCAVMFFVAGAAGGLQERISKQFKWDVQLMPAHPQGRFTATLTYGYGIARGTTHPDLAWEFVKSIASLDVQRAIAAQRAGVPILTQLANDPAIMSSAAPDMQVFVRGIEFGISPPAYPIKCGTFYGGLVLGTLNDAFVYVMTKGSSVEDAFKKADQIIQACIDGG